MVQTRFLREFFGHRDILVTCIVFATCVAFTLPHLNQGAVWGALVLGMVLYALSEYLIHRFFFHLPPPKTPWLLWLLQRLHYHHHKDPDDLRLLFLPIWYSFPLVATVAGIVYAVSGDTVFTVAFTTGVLGYLLYYEWCHYVAHRPIQPITPWGRWLKKMHLWHHFKNEQYWYGVTNPVFDMVMGTFKNEREADQSDSVRDLEKQSTRYN
ncbi:sterol desaturase family protein [Polycladomyces subterraneus]|uniref:Sterol desaturase family protein n=1 Tax=Polycladomyces subterraneus TaxID=1016997 RepID=A0ABT8IKK9_9BACL|nr:sterol desaturase family protein [Polycladomyces subterraneus]MDN4593315.1 sterol desaturase family protein [Polycladomyces subterraneus]